MNTILEVAIGLLFVFLLFSLLVSAVNEAIFGHLTHQRSRVLDDTLHAILSNNDIWEAVVVVWLNVDTIELTRRLLADAQFRGTLAAGALGFMTQANVLNDALTADSNPLSSAGGPSRNANTPAAASQGGGGSPSVSELLQQVGKLNLPQGWGACTNAAHHSWIGAVITRLPRLQQSTGINTNSAAYALVNGAFGATTPCLDTPEAWRLKVLGLIITIAAVSQGAPFWFDLLNRVTNLRAAGRPPHPK